MTKKIVLLNMVLLFAMAAGAQADTCKVEQYCQLIATQRILSNKVTIDIDFGEEKSFFRDTRLTNYDGKIKKFNTIIDAMNYMGKEGWLFVNAYPVHLAGTEIFHFAFKKQFTTTGIQH
ncbi:MAG: hypothetical protein ABIQ88_11245 [Chitinophagaceae bacterium]